MEGGTGKLRLTGPSSDPMYPIIRQEIESFNSIFGFPSDVGVTIEKCGEANAYYDPSEVSITICTEFDAHLRQQFDNLWSRNIMPWSQIAKKLKKTSAKPMLGTGFVVIIR